MNRFGRIQIAALLAGVTAIAAFALFAVAPSLHAAPQSMSSPANTFVPNGAAANAPTPPPAAQFATPATSQTLRLPGFGSTDEAAVKRIRDARAQAALSYSGRPLAAIGTLEELNLTSMTLKMKIDPEASAMPESLRNTAKRIGTTEELRSSEFSAERTFPLGSSVLYLDARLSANKAQTRADTGKILEDKQRLKPGEFSAGDRISVLYRRAPNATDEARVLTVSKVDFDQKNFDVDSNPLGPNARVIRRTQQSTSQSTSTIVYPSGVSKPAAPTRRPSAIAAPTPSAQN